MGGQRLQGKELSRARAALDLPKRRTCEQATDARPSIDESELIVRLLRPLRQKGRLGRLHTTPFEHVCGHGVPDHLKAKAKAQAEQHIAEGCLAEKVSQSRRHVGLTEQGWRLLPEAERRTSGREAIKTSGADSVPPGGRVERSPTSGCNHPPAWRRMSSKKSSTGGGRSG